MSAQARRNRAQAEMIDYGGVSVLDVDLPDRRRGTSFFLDAKFNMQFFALVHAEQAEAAGLLAESQDFVDRTRGVVLRDVFLDAGAVAATEGVEPGLEGVPRRGIGNRSGLRPSAGGHREEQEQVCAA